jgi:hypothetical protein
VEITSFNYQFCYKLNWHWQLKIGLTIRIND